MMVPFVFLAVIFFSVRTCELQNDCVVVCRSVGFSVLPLSSRATASLLSRPPAPLRPGVSALFLIASRSKFDTPKSICGWREVDQRDDAVVRGQEPLFATLD